MVFPHLFLLVVVFVSPVCSFVVAPTVVAPTVLSPISNHYKMCNQADDAVSDTDEKILRQAYEAFNTRDIDGALSVMTKDVTWPRAFKGGFVEGPDEVRAYWSEQWSEINPTVEPISFQLLEDSRDAVRKVLVTVHQVVRDLTPEATVLVDVNVDHQFTIVGCLIKGMDVIEVEEQGINTKA